MIIIKIYMFFVIFCCYFLMFVKDKENIFKSMVIVPLWFISFSVLFIMKKMGY